MNEANCLVKCWACMYPQVKEFANWIIINTPKDVEVLKKELENLDVLIREAIDRVAVAAEANEVIKHKKLVEERRDLTRIYFSIEDAIDDWNLCLELEKMTHTAVLEYMKCKKRKHCHNGCVTLTCESAKFLCFKYDDRIQIVFTLRSIKSDVGQINDGIIRNSSSREEQISSTKNADMAWTQIQQRSTYPGKYEIVGFEDQNQKLIAWLKNNDEKLNVMVVVGMAGQGKTTLVKQIYDNEVIHNFQSCVWIDVSKFNSPTDFFRFMLKKLYEQTGVMDDRDEYIHSIGLETLKDDVKIHLGKKRYVFFFDDVWNKQFWKDIVHTVSDNKRGSRIIITTRNKEVAKTCKISYGVKVHEMQPLTHEQSLNLFYQVAYKDDDYNLSSDIVKKCDGLPLGIVAIGMHINGEENRNTFKWKSKIQEAGITKTLGLSYDYLPDHLKPCLLYFGIYPQDSPVKSTRLIRQWIAEGFVVSHEEDISVEEIAEGYLASLIDRYLVQVSSFTIDGKPRSCRIHYLVHDMIHRKLKDLSFCQCINEDNLLNIAPILTRHLSIATKSNKNLPGFFVKSVKDIIQSSSIRSLHFFTKQELPEEFVRIILEQFKTLRVLDFEESGVLSTYFDDLGDLIHLKYLSFRKTQVQSLPKSIRKLINLETLDLRQSVVNVIPKEVSKLKKLRHLLGDNMSLIQLKDVIGEMESLITLRDVKIDEGEVGIVKELEELYNVRDLGLTNVCQIHGEALCSAMNNMVNLVKLSIIAKESENEVIDLQKLEERSKLRKLRLQGKFSLPSWVPDHKLLVKLILSGLKLTVDALISLERIPNLLFLSIMNEAYEGENLDFKVGFQLLRELKIESLSKLNSITIDNNALPSLQKLTIKKTPELNMVGIEHLNLKNFDYKPYATSQNN